MAQNFGKVIYLVHSRALNRILLKKTKLMLYIQGGSKVGKL